MYLIYITRHVTLFKIIIVYLIVTSFRDTNIVVMILMMWFYAASLSGW